MKELIIAFGLFLFIEGILYAIFPSKMKNMIMKLNEATDNQLRTGGLIFAVIGFFIIWYLKR
ncbi:ubiquitin-binding protein [Pelagibacteraceae bacterium GOM-A2]|nr:ubiquitin-binding protein [Pelagibacteraceae bacterium GOM-A2]